jgi:hypothetical protein
MVLKSRTCWSKKIEMAMLPNPAIMFLLTAAKISLTRIPAEHPAYHMQGTMIAHDVTA